MLRNLCSIICIFFYGSLFAQMAVHSDVYLGSEYELYNAFDLTSFHSGIIYIDRNGGVFSFSADASWENSDNTKHLDGSIRKYSPNAFTFPSGHGGQYQPLHVSQAAGNSYIDVSGVALKGVQALIEKVETLKEKVEGLKIENSNYQNKLQKQELLLQQLMTRLEALENQ